MAFGIRNVPDRRKALREIRRVLSVAQPTSAAASRGKRRRGARPSRRASGDGPGDGEVSEGGGTGAGGERRSVVAILEVQDPESGLLMYAARAFVR